MVFPAEHFEHNGHNYLCDIDDPRYADPQTREAINNWLEYLRNQGADPQFSRAKFEVGSGWLGVYVQGRPENYN